VPTRKPGKIERPALFTCALMALALASLAAAGGIWRQYSDKIFGPAILVAGADDLTDALADAPLLGGDRDGPKVWVIADSDCPLCQPLFRETLPDLRDRGFDVRVMLVSRAADQARDAAFVAVLAKNREWQAFETWAFDSAVTEGTPGLSGPEEVEGYLEWGRASLARVEAVLKDNDLTLKLPIVIWRRGPEWRVAPALAPQTFERARRDLAYEG
jgi:hypothetical protein